MKRLELLLAIAFCIAGLGRCRPSPSSSSPEDEGNSSISQKWLDGMLRKAILNIIAGDMSEADQRLLRSFNYSHADIQAIRQMELKKREESSSSPGNDSLLTEVNKTEVYSDARLWDSNNETRVYEGVEWVGGDVYRVVPRRDDNEDNENGTRFKYDEQILEDGSNETLENGTSPWVMAMDDPERNLTSYEKFMVAQRKE